MSQITEKPKNKTDADITHTVIHTQFQLPCIVISEKPAHTIRLRVFVLIILLKLTLTCHCQECQLFFSSNK